MCRVMNEFWSGVLDRGLQDKFGAEKQCLKCETKVTIKNGRWAESNRFGDGETMTRGRKQCGGWRNKIGNKLNKAECGKTRSGRNNKVGPRENNAGDEEQT